MTASKLDHVKIDAFDSMDIHGYLIPSWFAMLLVSCIAWRGNA